MKYILRSDEGNFGIVIVDSRVTVILITTVLIVSGRSTNVFGRMFEKKSDAN